MTTQLHYYRDYRPDGKIYAYCEGELSEHKIIYALYQKNKLIEKKKGYGDELVGFAIPGPGTFRLSVKVVSDNDHNHDETLYSDEIIVPEVARLPPRPAHSIKSLKGHVALVPGVDNYLQIKFFDHGLDKLKKEKQCNVPVYYTVRNAVTFVPLFTRDVIKTLVKSMPMLANLADIYKVDAPIPEDQLLALAQELEQLEYVEYCCLLSKLVGARRPERGMNDDDMLAENTSDEENTPLSDEAYSEQSILEEDNNAQSTPLIATPDFTPQQTYLNDGLGLNVRTAWARNVSGQNIRIHLADERIDAEHEDIINSVTVEGSGSTGFEGTSNTGIIRANNNGFGVTGIAFNSNLFIYSSNNINAIFNHLRPGDIVVINSYIIDFTDELVFFPIVHNNAGWDSVSRMVSAGAVVVFSSGEVFDLGSPPGINLRQSNIFRNWGDSGAIMACGCSPNNGRRSHETNYNLYNMVNAWDEGVTSIGGWGRYLIFNEPPRPHRNYTNNASYTSASAAQVAAAMALIQSYARLRYGVVFNTADMLSVIEITGSRQAQGQMIGVRPNVAIALLEVDLLLGNNAPLPPPPPPPYPAWVVGVRYQRGDRVSHQGRNFECLQSHLSTAAQAPLVANTIWRLLSTPQVYPQWLLGSEYQAGDQVTYQGINYQCLQRHIPLFDTWSPSENPLLWVKI